MGNYKIADAPDVLTKIEKIKTKRFCRTCKESIYKIYQIEIDRRTNRIISRICIWDRMLSCSADCEFRMSLVFNKYTDINEELPINLTVKENKQ